MSPAVAPARVAARRVQGIDSSLSDLVLRDGESLKVKVGKAILQTPALTRTIQGSSTIKLTLYDPELRFLRVPLLAEKWNAELDGLHWRYFSLSKTGYNLSLTLEDRNIARLREFRGPKKVYARRGKPNEVTRAEFLLSLVQEALPRVDYSIPELHDQQPIETESQGAKAREDATDRREPGLGGTKGLTVKGQDADQSQVEAGERAIRTALSHNAPHAVLLALMESLIVESGLGDYDSNWLQIEPPEVSGFNGDRTNLEESVVGFLKGYEPRAPTALGYAREHPEAKPHEIAQAVQRSDAGASTNGAANYGPWQDEAAEWVDAFEGAGAGTNTAEERKPRKWEVGKNENYWEAIQRLAKEVNWRAFFVGDRFYYIDEYELARGMVRLAIRIDADPQDRDYISPANINFDYNGNKAVTEVTVKCPVRQWKPPPGSVVTLTGFGPASIGFGDAPRRKGQKIGLSGSRKAATGEGTARYIVVSIEVPLTEDPSAREATIKLRKPTAPLPEPAPETRTVSTGTTGSSDEGAGDERVQRVRDFCEDQIGKPYVWGAAGPDSYDCSGFVSAALIAGDFLSSRLTTSTLASWGEAGEGEFITVHDKAGTGDPRTEHVLIEVDGEIYECGGISGGVGRPDYSSSALAEFSTKRHPKGY